MHWAQIGEVGFLGGIRFLHWVYRHGGVWIFRIFLLFPITWYFLFHGTARRASLEYLARLRETSGGGTPAPTWRNSFRHFMSFGESILDKLLATDEHEAPQEAYRDEGVAAFHRRFDQGGGALVIAAHFGNLELCRRLGRHYCGAHIRITLLVHTRHAQRFQRLLRSLNPSHDVDLVHVDSIDVSTAMLLSERIAEGHIVVITGDRVPVTPGTHATLRVPFLGREAHFPMGPYILGSALGCPVYSMFSARGREGFSVSMRLLADPVVLPRRGREEAVRAYLQVYAGALAMECMKHPFQWFNFFPFWQDKNSDEKPAKPLA